MEMATHAGIGTQAVIGFGGILGVGGIGDVANLDLLNQSLNLPHWSFWVPV